ncbi:hypothetical protein BB559_002446 [Furculomyces boomerangus]|uniref:GH16 domain-containing protein n=2 Tax=Harpellales TaxID=61421 RepID=A0A2T9YGN1_9FUNG|nr:hypothetical protein BB559_004780 [Furculomyces boomerangus]PVU91506.1 hypothetical protein BB559_004092 [Furculomyces boomerangus]PVU96283.1 hypothetical protein BB559_002446 [Furculomyces boomerangus]PVZ97437.1 hypothetical protein BB558_006592 [Smittium angustum]PVZ99326.1 hypothetical protein BB558_004672 [Smittium angustum]
MVRRSILALTFITVVTKVFGAAVPIKKQFDYGSPSNVPNEVPGSQTYAVQNEYAMAKNVTCGAIQADFSNPNALSLFNVEWCPQNAVVVGGQLELSLTSACGTTISYPQSMRTGKVEITLKIAPGSGVVTAIVLAGPAPSDEIDIEMVGKDLTTFQSMYFVRAQRVDQQAQFHTSPNPSAANLSTNYHKYGVELLDNAVNWYIDDVLVRTLSKTSDYSFPSNANLFRFGLWDGSNTSGWAGIVDWSAGPIKAYVKSISISPYC